MLIHAEQVAGENTGFVATRARADLHLRILAVLRVRRQQQQADLLFQRLLLVGEIVQLHLGHIPHLIVGLRLKDLFRLLDVG